MFEIRNGKSLNVFVIKENVKLFIRHGFNIFETDPKGYTIMDLLQNIGDDLKIKSESSKSSISDEDGYEEYYDAINIIEKLYFRLHSKETDRLFKVLQDLINNKKIKMVKSFMHNSNYKLINNYGENPVQTALHCLEYDMAEAMVDYLEDVNSFNSLKYTTLDTAKEYFADVVIEKLLKRGAKTYQELFLDLSVIQDNMNILD